MKQKLLNALELTFENAQSLYEEAEILIANQKIGRGYSLFHLSFEESGRYNLIFSHLRDFYCGRIKLKDLNYGSLKKLGFERHDKKISKGLYGIYFSALVDLYFKKEQEEPFADFLDKIDVNVLEGFQEKIGMTEEQGIEFNRLKNAGLYVSYFENDFRLPDDVITMGQYDRIKNLARLGLRVVEIHHNHQKRWGWS